MMKELVFFLYFLYILSWPANGLQEEECPLQSPYVYIEYNAREGNDTYNEVSNVPLEDEPQFDIRECSFLPGTQCCSCEEESYYICSSLDEALQIANGSGLQAPPLQQLYISLGEDEEWRLSSGHSLGNFSSLVIQGFGKGAEIRCSDSSVGIQVNGSCHSYIDNVHISNCRGVVLTNNINTNISNSEFRKSNGSALIINNGRWIHYLNCDFGEHYTPKHDIRNSKFIRNGNTTSGAVTKYGGGLNFNIQAPAFASLQISDCTFDSNSAEIGGGVYYDAEGIHVESNELCPIVSRFEISRSLFMKNSVTTHGGAVYASGFEASYTDVNFTGNYALYTAGGVYQYIDTASQFTTGDCSNNGVIFNNCTWDYNIAVGSAGLLLFSTIDVNTSPVTTSLMNCLFVNNKATQVILFGQASCVIHSENMPIHLNEVFVFNNTATGICLQSTNANFSGEVTFRENNGFYGGAAYIDRSTFVFHDEHNVTFAYNTAVFGGAVYQNSIPASHCIFHFQQDSTAGVTTVTFDSNNAISNGNSIYFTEPNSDCLGEIRNKQIAFFPNDTSQYSSGAFHIQLHDPVINDTLLELILGQKLVINATILNYFNVTSTAEVRLFLTDDGGDTLQQTLHHRLNGFRQFSIANGVNYPNLFIMGPEINSSNVEYELLIFGLHVQKKVNVILKKCPLGYVYNTTSQICECVKTNGIVSCSAGTACIRKGYWLGEVDGRYTTSLCESGICNSSSNNCNRCAHDMSNDDYCQLPATENGQCLNNRAGRLCASCEQDYSFTFGITKCVQDSTCKQGQGIVTPFLNIVFVVMTFFLIIFVLKFDYKLSSGYIFCFVYYFSIVNHLLPTSLVGNTLLAIVSILESVTQLNPQFLGYLPICFFQKLEPLAQQAFLFINPIIISILVLATISLSKCCSKRIAFKDNTLIKAICLLLLLSFTAITETSFRIMNGVTFAGIDQIYVTIEPQIKYFSTNKHIPWFILGIAVIVFLVIPFTLLLLLAPLLTRCFNMNKIKPFLDEFQGCYKDNFRWMAGYYFLCRFIYYIVLAAPILDFVRLQYSIQLLSFTILVIHMLLQPYQSSWLNFADSLLLADLTLLMLLFGETGDVAFGRSSAVRQGIVYVLVFIPVFYLIIIITVTATHRFNINEKKKKKKRQRDILRPLINTTSYSRRRNLSESVGYREPVLGLLESENNDDAYYYSPSSTENSEVPIGRSVGYSILESPHNYKPVDVQVKGERSKSTSSQAWQDNDDELEGDDL